MAKKFIVPAFASEAQDAAWHESHKRELEAEMGRRIRSGTTLSQSQVLADTRATRKLRPVTIRLPMEDIDVARNLAAAKGMGYQTYIRMLLREVLHRKARKQTRS